MDSQRSFAHNVFIVHMLVSKLLSPVMNVVFSPKVSSMGECDTSMEILAV